VDELSVKIPETENRNWMDWNYPDELDAMIAAPNHHHLLMENDFVRVLDVRIAPGDITPVHTHRWAATLYILSWSDFIRYDGEENIMVDSRNIESMKNPPPALWSEPLPPHALKNIGDKEIRVISVEIKK